LYSIGAAATRRLIEDEYQHMYHNHQYSSDLLNPDYFTRSEGKIKFLKMKSINCTWKSFRKIFVVLVRNSSPWRPALLAEVLAIEKLLREDVY
jgi:hypothetical protein